MNQLSAYRTEPTLQRHEQQAEGEQPVKEPQEDTLPAVQPTKGPSTFWLSVT